MKKIVSVPSLERSGFNPGDLSPLDEACIKLLSEYSRDYNPNFKDFYNTRIKGSQNGIDETISARRKILNHLASKSLDSLYALKKSSGSDRKVILNQELRALELPTRRDVRHLMKIAIQNMLVVPWPPRPDDHPKIRAAIKSWLVMESWPTIGMNLTSQEIYAARNGNPRLASHFYDHGVNGVHEEVISTSKFVTISESNRFIFVAVILQRLGLELGAYHKQVVGRVLMDCVRDLNRQNASANPRYLSDMIEIARAAVTITLNGKLDSSNPLHSRDTESIRSNRDALLLLDGVELSLSPSFRPRSV